MSRRRLAVALVAVAVMASGCNSGALNSWLAAHGKPRLAEPQLSRMVTFLTAIEDEVARRAGYVGEISTVDAARLGLSWRPGCPVQPTDLRLLRLSYWGFDGAGHVGEMVVNAKIASKVVGAFRTLWNEKFPINHMETAERYVSPDNINPDGSWKPGPDVPDTVDDTSSFLCRTATDSTSTSMHAYGLAIDINPVQNPYVKGSEVIPVNGSRDAAAPGTIVAGGVVVTAFATAGLIWGGTWSSLKDFMHFSSNGR